MTYSLQSRDLIADQVETAAGGHWLDGMVVVPGCDKNMPGVLMARTSGQYIRLYSSHYNKTQLEGSIGLVLCFMAAPSDRGHAKAHLS